ncbi:MBL fold metallo-hydrolase [Endozoicomonas arenosclerae]|uniref:MBL fold metallo-hydrolase n=1 Tax=Endozoicomonas arenosclerae TaxID=1633495 RepID=UPI000781CADE|nr:MBL fold metallo-hydrolase [Endozoicomonas arenosclerae]
MSRKFLKLGLTVSISVAVGIGAGMLLSSDKTSRIINERKAEALGTLASKAIASKVAPADPNATVKTVSTLHHIPMEVKTYKENIFLATGVGNTYLVKTSEGNILFDTGLPLQGAAHKRMLQEVAPDDVKYIVLSHSHQDHTGGARFWKAEYPEAKIVTHSRFDPAEQYLKDLEPYFWDRNRMLYTFMPEQPPAEDSTFGFQRHEPDITVQDGTEYRIELGGQEFVIIPTPGAEGDDNLVMWMPEKKALFTGDVFGPLFPMVPNLFTLRGERFRDPIDYIKSLDTMIALKPDMILPSHFEPVLGAEQIDNDLKRMREGTRYIHDETIAGMNAGKTLWELMQEIQLPEELGLSQGHGKVSWNVRSIWEFYSTWFRFESTTELYPVPVNTLYSELADLAGGSEILIGKANEKLAAKRPVQALHYVEMALSKNPDDKVAYQAKLEALQQLLREAYNNGSNFSETMWLKNRIAATEEILANS